MNLSTLADNLQGVRLCAHLPNGQVLHLGRDGPRVDWHLHCSSLLRRLLRRSRHELRRSYLRGEWDIDGRHLPTLLQALHPVERDPSPLRVAMERLCRGSQRTEAPPHWQASDLWLAQSCLGEELHQGCAHYGEPGLGLEQAQRIRCRELGRQLQLEPGRRLLDLNAGWGALALGLAQQTGATITAWVSSPEQLRYARQEARRRGLHTTLHFDLPQLHTCQERFDGIVGNAITTLGPAPNALLARLAELLRGDGMTWLQFYARRDPRTPDHWPTQSNRPAPLLSALHGALERTELRTLTLHNLSVYRLRDLHAYAARYRRRRAAIGQRFGEYRARYWELQLAGEIAALQQQRIAQYELLLGNAEGLWPPETGDLHPPVRLPQIIASKIPGLAPDL